MINSVIWITGLSGSGKTTLARALSSCIEDSIVLDGDEIRNSLERKYGFSLNERIAFVNNVIYLARTAIEFKKAKVVIVALISPLKEMRDTARDIITKYSNAKFIEVFMDTPLETCEKIDPKGLYKKARAGLINDFTGITSPYERPENPEFTIHNQNTEPSIVEILKVINK